MGKGAGRQVSHNQGKLINFSLLINFLACYNDMGKTYNIMYICIPIIIR